MISSFPAVAAERREPPALAGGSAWPARASARACASAAAAVLGRDDDRRQAPERRQAAAPALLGLLARRSARRRPTTSAAMTGCSGCQVCSSARPGFSPRPARPVAWRSSWNVRSAARGSPLARPTSASTTPTSVSSGKLWPLATSCVPMMRSIFAARRRVELRAQPLDPAGKVGRQHQRPRRRGTAPPTSSARRSTPGPQAVSVSASWHCGQTSGAASTWPQ